MRLECPIHGIVPREETVKGYEIAKDEYARFEPKELNALRGVRRSGGVDERARDGRHRAASGVGDAARLRSLSVTPPIWLDA
jgi:hypothetical protein